MADDDEMKEAANRDATMAVAMSKLAEVTTAVADPLNPN